MNGKILMEGFDRWWKLGYKKYLKIHFAWSQTYSSMKQRFANKWSLRQIVFFEILNLKLKLKKKKRLMYNHVQIYAEKFEDDFQWTK